MDAGPARLDRRPHRTFAFIAGVPAIVVSDNLRSGVNKAYEPAVNRTYAEMAPVLDHTRAFSHSCARRNHLLTIGRPKCSGRRFENGMPDAVQSLRSMRICGRSYVAYVLTPGVPVFDWLSDLDTWTRRSAGFFVGKPVVLDLSAVVLSKTAIVHLVTELQARDIRIMGIEGVDQADIGPELPPVLKGGRTATVIEPVDPATHAQETPARPVPRPEPASLLLESPVRSGQSIMFPAGDVTVMGAVASGAEIIAGGSIHVYGALRGRALAGSHGNPRARIFCNKLEAELLAIDGFYRAAEDMEPDLRGRPIQAWLQDEMMFITQLS